ncbi:hypothetical protein HBH70_151510 [Parastagonospora nodorum]|nr:hypothetical protein HBH53_167420 [Parastagonospora nodorum]KAH3965425.1 hypothetical protein HBH51_150820 [Parastagonospora nodorum]KAH4000273.1 hypothetical protein HBI10_110670 [Parastagonospora nodorum]KAH4022131.1 hypothetical protein HBI13_098550 [Parastagonospora nodorum]KAH4027868.1 hypothetical protein HBI09_144300 [Parastagonospora nodorum]
MLREDNVLHTMCEPQSFAPQTTFVYTLGLGLWPDVDSVRVLNSNKKLQHDIYIQFPIFYQFHLALYLPVSSILRTLYRPCLI